MPQDPVKDLSRIVSSLVHATCQLLLDLLGTLCVLLCDNWRMLWPDLPLGPGADSALHLFVTILALLKPEIDPKLTRNNWAEFFKAGLR